MVAAELRAAPRQPKKKYPKMYESGNPEYLNRSRANRADLIARHAAKAAKAARNAEIIASIKTGETHRSIAKQLHVSRPTIWRTLQKYGVQRCCMECGTTVSTRVKRCAPCKKLHCLVLSRLANQRRPKQIKTRSPEAAARFERRMKAVQMCADRLDLSTQAIADHFGLTQVCVSRACIYYGVNREKLRIAAGLPIHVK